MNGNTKVKGAYARLVATMIGGEFVDVVADGGHTQSWVLVNTVLASFEPPRHENGRFGSKQYQEFSAFQRQFNRASQNGRVREFEITATELREAVWAQYLIRARYGRESYVLIELVPDGFRISVKIDAAAANEATQALQRKPRKMVRSYNHRQFPDGPPDDAAGTGTSDGKTAHHKRRKAKKDFDETVKAVWKKFQRFTGPEFVIEIPSPKPDFATQLRRYRGKSPDLRGVNISTTHENGSLKVVIRRPAVA